MKKTLIILFILMIALGVIGCSNLKEVSKQDIVDKVYVYEKDGCGSEFIIKINADGTFTYSEGVFSSHAGIGEWTYSEGMLTLFENSFQVNEKNEWEEVINSYNFSVTKNALIFVNEDSDNFIYVEVKDGEKFFVQ